MEDGPRSEEAGKETLVNSRSPIISALIAALVSVVITGLGWLWNEIRFRRQHRAEAAVKKLLTSRGWTLRSFEAIKEKIGGYEDDELRRLLVRSGAIRFKRKTDNEELWGLLKKNKGKLD